MPAKIIAFEGLDGSFKETTANNLSLYLKARHNKVEIFSFPDHETKSSYFVDRYLNGFYQKSDFSSAKDRSSKFSRGLVLSTFYAYDRFDTFFKYNIWDLVNDDNAIIIFDRYCMSNLYYQTAEVADTLRDGDLLSEQMMERIMNLEHEVLRLPVEDLTIFMRTPMDVTRRVLSEREGTDIHESNMSFIEMVDRNIDRSINTRSEFCKTKQLKVPTVKILNTYDKENDKIFTRHELLVQVIDILDEYFKEDF